MLRPGERIIYQARLSRFRLVFYSLLGIICLPGLGFLGLLIIGHIGKFSWGNMKDPIPTEMLPVLFIIFLFFGIFTYIFAKYSYDYFKTEIAVTDQRIIGKVPRRLAALDHLFAVGATQAGK